MIDRKLIDPATGKIDLSAWRERVTALQTVGRCRCGKATFPTTETRDSFGVIHLDVECSAGHSATIRHSRQLAEPEPVGVG